MKHHYEQKHVTSVVDETSAAAVENDVQTKLVSLSCVLKFYLPSQVVMMQYFNFYYNLSVSNLLSS